MLLGSDRPSVSRGDSHRKNTRNGGDHAVTQTGVSHQPVPDSEGSCRALVHRRAPEVWEQGGQPPDVLPRQTGGVGEGEDGEEGAACNACSGSSSMSRDGTATGVA